MLSDDQYDFLVETIYQAAVDPLQWAQVVDSLTNAFDAIGASIYTPFATRLGFEPVWSTNADPDFIQAYAANYAKSDIVAAALWRRIPFSDFVYRWEDIVDRKVIEDWDGYQKLLGPRGVHTGIGVISAGSDHRVGQAMIYLPDWPENRVNAAKKALIRLARHLRQAMSIHWHLAQARQAASTAQLTLDMFRAGVMWLSPRGEILYRNSEMDRLLELKDGLGVRSGKLALTETDDQRKLREAIVLAETDTSTVLAIKRPLKGGSFYAKIMPLPLAASALRLPNAAVIVFISEPCQSTEAAATEIARIHGLTPAEARVFERIAKGTSLQAISNELGTSLFTVRTQLRSVMAKCGAHRQADLVRLVASFPPVG
jgi:DNA-binding CsgD family transcriptional regulator